jgi:hypothetical protein
VIDRLNWGERELQFTIKCGSRVRERERED